MSQQGKESKEIGPHVNTRVIGWKVRVGAEDEIELMVLSTKPKEKERLVKVASVGQGR